MLITLAFALFATPAQAAPGEVVILDTTVSGGVSSTLAQKFVAAGKTPILKTPGEWSAMSSAEFDAFDGIVLGDPTCASLGPAAAAQANAALWSSVVDGNVIIIGTDETYHQGQGGTDLMEKAAAFSVAEAGKTGAYISLSCYYHDTAPMTPVPLLSGFGTFTATGVGCYNDAHIVATHPALVGLTDTTLSNWSCSVHEAFDSFPISFEVLAIAEDIGNTYTAPDGSVGTPYILARGVEVISDIRLSPEEATNPIGTPHTVTATVTNDEPTIAAVEPVAGKLVTFKVIDGPHAGLTGTGTTDASGNATFTYTGTAIGTDTIEATFVDDRERTQRSNRVTKTWVDAPVIPTVAAASPTVSFSTSNKCLRGSRLRISPSYASGTPSTVSLYVDGKLKKKVSWSKPTFVINLRGYKPGTHRVRVVTTYADGRSASATRRISKCRVRAAARRVTPQFTG
ncbi:MAG: Ig-like domain-containing protein [Actinobacteria bacterium]|nr:Ig-like domain-containing protein [Actinomycetota bacterium]